MRMAARTDNQLSLDFTTPRKSPLLDWIAFRAYLKSPHIDPSSKKPSGRIFLQEHERNARSYGARYLSSFMDVQSAEEVAVDIMHDASQEMERTLKRNGPLKSGRNFYGYFNSLVLSRIIDRSRRLKARQAALAESPGEIDWAKDKTNQADEFDETQETTWDAADIERITKFITSKHKAFHALVLLSLAESKEHRKAFRVESERLNLTIPAAKKKCRAIIAEMKEHLMGPPPLRFDDHDHSHYMLQPIQHGKAYAYIVTYHHHDGSKTYIDKQGQPSSHSSIIPSKQSAIKAMRKHQRT